MLLFYQQQQCTVNGGLIDSITVNTGGQYLPTGITATITGDGVGAQVTPVIVNGQLQSVTIDDVGANYTTATISFAAVRGGFTTKRLISLTTTQLLIRSFTLVTLIWFLASVLSTTW